MKRASKPSLHLFAAGLKPINVDDETWMYAERRGLCVVRQLRNPAGKLVHADMFYLSWAKIRRAVAIKDASARKPPRRKR